MPSLCLTLRSITGAATRSVTSILYSVTLPTCSIDHYHSFVSYPYWHDTIVRVHVSLHLGYKNRGVK